MDDIGQSITFSATVADADGALSDLTISWDSSIDGQLSTPSVDAAGVTAFALDSLSRGDHVLTVRATDPLGFYDEAAVTLRVNGPPTPPVVDMSVDNPATDEPLTVVIVQDSDDAEADALTYHYAWSRQGLLIDDLVAASLPADRTTRDETWTVEVWASDGRLVGERSVASTTVVNTPPVAMSVVLAPASPTTNDVVTADVETSDLDADPVDLTFAWSVNGTEVPGVSGPSLDGAAHFDRGDTVSVRVTPSDDAGSGVPLASVTLTTVNSPPSAPTVETDPRFTFGNADARCVIVEDSVDADGDQVTYTLTWDGDGIAYPGDFPEAVGPETTEQTGDTVPAVDQGLADTFTCSVTASDGTTTTAPSTAFFDIASYVYDVGYWREFPYTGLLARSYLLGHPVVVPNDITVTELGIISKRTASNGRIALYREVDGVPRDLMVGSELQRINVGNNRFAVTPTPIAAGTYWLMAVYDSTAYPAEDRGRHTVYYISMVASSDFPTSLGTLANYTGYRHNYYLTGYE